MSHLVARLLGLSAPPASGLRYLSVCSGIEAATTAWHGLGWQPVAFSEIEPFPSAVLAHHWPHVPNLGDMTRWHEWPEELLASCDLIVGGTPCQAFSVAGLRNSLDDARGNLTLIYVHLINHIDRLRSERGLPTVIVVWENVPGVLSTKDNAFGCFLGSLAGEDEALVPPGKRWANAGLVVGPQRQIGYRTLDAQYFGVAQRRRRVFLVASARNGFCPGEVLFVEQGVRRDSPPSREAGQRTAGGFEVGPSGGSFTDLTPTLDARCKDGPIRNQIGAGVMTPTYWNGEQVSQTLDAVLAKGQTMPEKNRFPAVLVPDTAHTLRAEGFDAGEDGTGRGTPLVPVAFANKGHFGSMSETEVSDPIRAKGGDTGNGGESIVAFSCKDHGGDASEIAPTLRSMGHDGSHANGGGQVAVAFHPTQDPISSEDGSTHAMGTGSKGGCATVAVAFAQNQVGEVRTGEVLNTLNTNSNASGRNTPMVQNAMQVRRLTPTECERLQGFPDGHTLISWKKKPADDCPDGPRYKALGNSMAIPVVSWIGRKIAKHLQA